MDTRLRHVLLTYTTRPLISVLSAIYFVIWGTMTLTAFHSWTYTKTEPAHPQLEARGRTQWLNPGPLSIKDADQQDLDPSIVTALFATPNVSAWHLIQLVPCSQLRVLKLDRVQTFDEEMAVALSSLPSLEELSLVGSRLPSTIFQHLGKLPNLTLLDLSGCELHGDYAGLESLSRLETLVLGSPGQGFSEFHTRFLPQLQRLPRLNTLVLHEYYSLKTMQNLNTPGAVPQHLLIPDDPIKDSLEDLKAINNLRTLYVNERATKFPGFSALKRELPGVCVRPNYVDIDRIWAIACIALLDTIILLLLSSQLHSHFSNAGSRLIPGYMRPHLVPPTAIWIGTCVTNCIPLLIRGVPFITALASSILPWLLICGFSLFGGILDIVSESTRARYERLLKLAMIGLFFSVYITALWIMTTKRSLVDWYLRGNYLGLSWTFIIVGSVFSAAYLWALIRSCAAIMERSSLSPPLSRDPSEMAAWNQDVSWREADSTRGAKQTRGEGRRLERIIEAAAQGGWRRRSDLWIAANRGSGNIVTVLMCCLMVIVLAGQILMMGGLSRFAVQQALQSPLFLMFSSFFADVIPLVIAMLWRRRRSFFAIESLRPLSRSQFSRETALAIAWDLSPLGCAYGITLAVYAFQAGSARLSVVWVLAMLLFLTARWTIAFSLTLWGIVIQREWIVIPMAIFALYAFAGANLAIIVSQSQAIGINLPVPVMSSGVLAGFSLVLGTVGVVTAKLGYSQWKKIELP